MKKLLSVILLAAALCLAFAGCGEGTPSDTGTTSGGAVSQETIAEDAEDDYVTPADDFDWMKVFATEYATDSPFYVALPDNQRGFTTLSGTYSLPIDGQSVVLMVDSGSKDTAEDFNLDLSAVKELEDIIPNMQYTFTGLLDDSGGVHFMTDEKDPFITVESSEKMQVQAVRKTYDVLKSYGTFHYMYKKAATTEPEYERTASFIAYSTFLEDGMPFYCAAVDVTDGQDASEACETRALQLMQGLNEVPASFFGY